MSNFKGQRGKLNGMGLGNHRKRISLALLVMVLILGICVPVLAEAGPEEILSAVQSRYADVGSMTADYTRVTSTPAMEGLFKTTSKHTASGFLIFKKPAKLILNQSSPRTEKMVTDGQTVWWYIPDENLVHRYTSVDIYGELKPLLDFLGGLTGLEGRFAIKVTPAGTGTEVKHRFDLTRLKEGSGPAGITVWFEPQSLDMTGFRLTSVLGETTDFTLRKVKLNQALDDRIFFFRIPPGAEVIDEAGE